MSSTIFRRPMMAWLVSLMLIGAAGAAQADPIETMAHQAMLLDFDTGTVLLEKNADEQMPPSSMSKLMTVYVVFERLRDGSLHMDDTLPVSENAWRKQGSKMFVHVGDRVRVEDLLRGVIIQSGNDACIVLAEGIANSEEAFAAEANREAKKLGLEHSTFRNATGWPDPGHLMTARDLSILARHIIADFPEYYKFFSEMGFTYNNITQGNRNPLLYKNIGADGLKTGHTEIAGFGLTASVVRGGRRLILVVNGLPSMQMRSDESDRLIEWGFREFSNFTLFEAGQEVSNAEVWLGNVPKVPLVTKDKLMVTLTHKARKDLKVSAVYNGPIAAPIRKGTPIALLTVTAPGMPPVEVPLLAGADVEKLGPIGRIGAAVKHILWGPEN